MASTASTRTVTPLRMAIVASGRSQRSIAEEIGIHETTLSKIVNGWHTEDATREAIARALGQTTDELFPPEPDRIAA